MNTVSDACKSYFNGFQGMHCDKKCDGGINALGFLKILSYFTLVLPLTFAIVYACSALVDRVCPERNRKPLDQQIVNLSQKLLGKGSQNPLKPAPQPKGKPQPVVQVPAKLVEYKDADLEEFFKSKIKCQKLFLIKGVKVGIAFDPSGARISMGIFSGPPVMLVANVSLPKEVVDIVRAKAPKNQVGQFSMIVNSYNGRPLFEALGFEGTYFDEAPAETFTKAFLTADPKTYQPPQKVAKAAPPKPPKKGVDAELEEFFQSKQKCQKLFVVNGEQVGIIFDPSGNKIKFPKTGKMSASSVILVHDNSYSMSYGMLSNDDLRKILSNYPKYKSHDMHIVGREGLKDYGFGGDPANAPAPTFTKAFL